jgi:hypothetical protein
MAVGSDRKVTAMEQDLACYVVGKVRGSIACARQPGPSHNTPTKQPWKKIRPGVVSETVFLWSERWLIHALQTSRHDRTPTATWLPKLPKTTRPPRRPTRRLPQQKQKQKHLQSQTVLDPKSRAPLPRHVPRAALAPSRPLSKHSTTRWVRSVPWAM